MARIERIDVEQLHERAERDAGLQVLDVREQSEWAEGRIPGSLFTPYHDIHQLPNGLDPKRPVAAICGSGQRSAVAASLLQRYGAQEVLHVVEGGVPTWSRLGYPMEKPDSDADGDEGAESRERVGPESGSRQRA